MTSEGDGVGRTVLIAVAAAVVFAGFIVLAPRLTATSSEEGAAAAAGPAVAGDLPNIGDTAPGSSEAPLDIEVEITQPEVLPPGTATSSQPPTTSLSAAAPQPPTPGMVALEVDAKGPREAVGTAIAIEGDEIEWRFHVENVSETELWGIYVYLELHGPTWCEHRNLRPGEATDCWIATNAVEGDHTAAAWVTAWTLDHIVADQLEYSFTVTLF